MSETSLSLFNFYKRLQDWVDSDNERLWFTNWFPGQPNNAYKGRFASISYGKDMWGDWPGHTYGTVVCQQELDTGFHRHQFKVKSEKKLLLKQRGIVVSEKPPGYYSKDRWNRTLICRSGSYLSYRNIISTIHLVLLIDSPWRPVSSLN